MADYFSNADLEKKIKDIHRGVHMAMDQLINRKDYKRSEELLRQVDEELARVLRRNQVVQIR